MSFLKNSSGVAYTPNSGALLEPGTHDVTVKMVKEVSDHDLDLNGNLKAGYRFKNIHTQIAVLFAGEKGTIIRRFNTEGYTRHSELPEKARAKYSRDPETGYAVDKKGNRIENPKRTEDCRNIFNQFLNTLQKPDGKMLINDLAGKPVEDLTALFGKIVGCKCRIEVIEKVKPNGEKGREVKSIRKISAAVALVAADVDDTDADEGDLP